MKYTQQGFGVLEVMIVMIIMVILASLSYPKYDAQVKRSKRLEGQAFLADVAARQARYFAQNNRYITDSNRIVFLFLCLQDLSLDSESIILPIIKASCLV